jgi:uncharacterized protein YraI
MLSRIRVRSLAVLAAALAVGAAMLVTAGTASANTHWGQAKAPNGLTIRSGPGAGFNAEGTLAYNASITVDCYSYGSDVNGDYWWDSYHTSSGGPYYVSDYWLYTGGDITGQVDSCETDHYNETPGIAQESGGLPYYDDYRDGYAAGTGPQEGSLAYGRQVNVECYRQDSSGTLWDDVFLGTSGGQIVTAYVLDAYLYTGGDVTKQTSAVCPS